MNVALCHTGRVETTFRRGVRAIGGLGDSDFFRNYNLGAPQNCSMITLGFDTCRWRGTESGAGQELKGREMVAAYHVRSGRPRQVATSLILLGSWHLTYIFYRGGIHAATQWESSMSALQDD